MYRTNRRLTIFFGILAALLFAVPISAQRIRSRDRITTFIDDARTVRRPGNRHPLARPEFDAGRASKDVRMERMILVLQPDAAQQDTLTALVAAQHDPESPQYQQWLTPESFGQTFGASERDVEQVVNWLQGHGFDVEPISAGRGSLVFSGTTAQVESAFHTQIHVYDVGGEIHHANSSDPEIPIALAPVVQGLVSLHDFQAKPQYVPDYTSGTTHYMSPADFATIYNLAPLYATSNDGTGQSIAIVGRTNLNLSDVQTFRSKMGLPPKDPTIILNGADPGIVSSGELGEATLDVEWSGAVAKNATILFVVSGSTHSTDGVDLSAQYIVTHNLAPILSLSFGSCEAAMGASENQYWNSLWQQAAAQGMSVFVASGDSGAAGCDSPDAHTAVHGAGVNGLCSSPYATCVGGTQFADTANAGLYWSTVTNPATYGSALTYIPEAAWNESGTVAGGSGLWATAGGASIVYPKPAWQSGTGVPVDNHRFVPDVSLSASGHDGYIIYMSGQLSVEGGTSASTPSFAGLMALTVQKAGARQGNANPAFYTLANLQNNGGPAVFHDVTAGNNSVPGQAGFSAGVGYDRATGLGSVDASMLVNHWHDASVPIPSFELSPSASTAAIIQGSSKTIAVSVTVSGGFSSAVALSASGLPVGLTSSFAPASIAAPGSGASTLTLSAAAQTVPGTYNISINGSGGGLNRTLPLAVTVSRNCSYSLNPTQASAGATAAGYSVAVTATTGCTWSAASNTSWITITATGNSTISYSVAANPSTSPRVGTMTIAGLTFTVTQAASASSLDPSTASITAAAGTGSTSLSTGTSWTAISNASWIAITNGASGIGSKTITYSVTANTSGTARIGTMTIAGLTFTVTQAAAAPSFSLNPAAATVGAAAGTGSVALSAASATASWTAVSNAAWIAITNGASGTGSKSIAYSFTANPSNISRAGTMTIAGLIFTVTQAAPAVCTYGITILGTTQTPNGAYGTIAVTTAPGCSWTAISSAAWLTVTSGASGTGNGTVAFTAAQNTRTTARTATITIGNRTLTVTEGPASATQNSRLDFSSSLR